MVKNITPKILVQKMGTTSLNNLTPADVFYGRSQSILDKREKIKLQTLARRRQMYYDNWVRNSNLMS